MNPLTWIPAIVTVVSALSMVIYAIQNNRVHTEHMEKSLVAEENSSKSNFDKLEMRITAATTNLSEALALIRVMQAEQSVINKVTAQTLNSIANKMEEHEKSINENALAIKLLQQKVNET